MNYNKLKAFTLAEVLVVILVLSILLAAYAPIFTKRYSDGARDEVWSFVSSNDNSDAYYDATNKTLTTQAYIGLTPINKASAVKYIKNASNQTIYSKLVIAASKDARISAVTRRPQNQIQFRYGNSDAGDLVGSLFAGNGNMLLGGPYSNITASALNNTAYGSLALSDITSGEGNTAVGYSALAKVTSGSANTAVGAFAGADKTLSGTGNTYLGYSAGRTSSSKYNTLIGYETGYKVANPYNTAVGAHSMKFGAGEYNVAVGYKALINLDNSSANNGNTAIGSGALSNLEYGKYNTAIGANSCTMMEDSSNKTCVGAYSGTAAPISSSTASTSNTITSKLYSDDEERIYLGAFPVDTLDKTPMAVLEVHNVSGSRNPSVAPSKNVGNPSVVVNGNLIVRGQSYLSVPIRRPAHMASTLQYDKTYKGLVAFQLAQADNNDKQEGFAGYDGAYRGEKSWRNCHGCKQHAAADLRPNCICTVSNASNTSAVTTSYKPTTDQYVSTSYDWSSSTTGTTGDDCENDDFGAKYTDKSFGTTVNLIRNDVKVKNGRDFESDRPLAHLKDYDSCCPILTSDRRLKNVKDAYTGGLAELKKLNIYNYTFKNDVNKIPHVGVIAQDLKLIFPNAVTKDEDGYLKIRWDEMLYATVNSIKTLYSKVENLVAKVKTDQERISNLKKDNAELNTKLDKLAEELTKLEAKKN
jgi:prepilin-type N-terminal cleavage/methylation domain-containing protein